MTGRNPVRGFVDAVFYRTAFLSTQGQNAGTFYTAGHYDFAADDTNLTQASQTQAYGTANEPTGAHFAIIAGGAGSASGGAGAVEIEISGTSINELGVRTESDTQIIVADITTMATDDYFETSKKWIGTVTITLQNASGSTQTTFAADMNYGHCKYTDMGDSNFKIVSFGADGLAKSNDAGFDVRLMKHSSAGWTYAATNFAPGNGEIVSLADDYSTESDLAAGEHFAYDRAGNIETFIEGAGEEGYIIEVTTGSNNSIEYMTAHVGFKYV